MRELAPAVAQFHAQRPEPIRSLPSTIAAATLPERIQGLPVLGVTDLDLRALPFDPAGGLVIAGPPQSGRTAALSWFAHSLARCHPRHRAPSRHAASQSSGVPELLDRHGCRTRRDCHHAQRSALATGRSRAAGWAEGFAVLVENAPEFADSDADSALTSYAVQARRGGHILVAEGETSQWGGSWGAGRGTEEPEDRPAPAARSGRWRCGTQDQPATLQTDGLPRAGLLGQERPGRQGPAPLIG